MQYTRIIHHACLRRSARLGDVAMFLACRPQKLKEGQQHPDPVVETLSLAAVEPPNVTYQHSLQVKFSTCLSLSARASPCTVRNAQPGGCGATRRHLRAQPAGEQIYCDDPGRYDSRWSGEAGTSISPPRGCTRVATPQLSSFECQPGRIRVLALQDCVREGELSALQLETIVYANQRFNGPTLPDGAHSALI